MDQSAREPVRSQYQPSYNSVEELALELVESQKDAMLRLLVLTMQHVQHVSSRVLQKLCRAAACSMVLVHELLVRRTGYVSRARRW
jgi:hypothetical protein